MERQHLIREDEVRSLARPISNHADKAEIMRFVEEVEDMYIIPATGVELFTTLCSTPASDTREYTLLNGGTYDNGQQMCHGLKKAVANHVYAKMLKNAGAIVARTGYMQHNDTHAQHIDGERKSDAWRDAVTTADFYLSSCWSFMNTWGGTPERVRGKVVTIKPLGV